MKAPENTSKARKLFPSGVSNARLWILADLGTQRFAQKPNEEGTRKLLFVFASTEYFDTFDEKRGEEPFTIMHEVAFFMNSTNAAKKTKLRQFIEGWRGSALSEDEARNYEFDKLPGQAATLMIAHTEKANGSGHKAVIQGASKPKSTEKVAALHEGYEPLLYSLDYGMSGTYKKLPEWLQKKIAESDEFKAGGDGSETTQGGGEEGPEINF